MAPVAPQVPPEFHLTGIPIIDASLQVISAVIALGTALVSILPKNSPLGLWLARYVVDVKGILKPPPKDAKVTGSEDEPKD